MSIGSNKMKLYSYMQRSSTRVCETNLVHWREQKQFIPYIQCKKCYSGFIMLAGAL